MDFKSVKQVFLTAKQAEGATNRTLETYSETVTKFFLFLVEKNIYAIEAVTANEIREFLNRLKNKGLRNVTLHKHFRVLRTLFLFLWRESYLDKNIIGTVKPPKKEQTIPRTFTGVEISKILNSFDRNEFFGLRNYAIMAVFFSTGIRKNELLNLTVQDVNITTDWLRIASGKGNKERFVPIGRTLRKTLLEYLRRREEFLQGISCLWLFPSRNKGKLTSSGINVIFQRLKKDLKLGGEKVSCHSWRHTFAKTFLMNGGDLISLQAILGHSDIQTTRGYLALNDSEIKTQALKFNPMDNSSWLL